MKRLLIIIFFAFTLVNCKKENHQEIVNEKTVYYKIVKSVDSDTLSGFVFITKTVNQITDTIIPRMHFDNDQSFQFNVLSGCKINTVLQMDSTGIINKPLHIITIDNGLQQLNSYDLDFSFYL